MWQYSESGRVSGISGNVDLDYCYKKYKKNNNDDKNSGTDTNSNTDKNNNKEDNIIKVLIKSLQNALNESYDCKLVEDGIWGPKTKAAVENHPLSIKSKNKKLEHTKWLQKSLKELGYDIAIDGYFGKDTQSTVERYQSKKKLQVDGIAGIKTHESIISYV